MFTKKDLDRSNIPVGEITTKHECPNSNKFYDIERGRKRLIGKAPFTGDWVMYVNGYLVTVFYCIYCGQKLVEDET